MNSSSATFVLFATSALLAGAGQAGAAAYTFKNLDVPGSTEHIFARAINDSGLMTGYGTHYESHVVYHGWIYGGGNSSLFFGPEEENYSHAFGINSTEKVVGDLELPDHTQRATVWNGTGSSAHARDTGWL